MKWTQLPAGQINRAFQRLMTAFGDRADIAVNNINSGPIFVERLAQNVLLNDWGITNTTLSKAQKIMGTNFFGINEAVKHFNIVPARRHLAAMQKVPFSQRVLESCKDSHILVAVFPSSSFAFEPFLRHDMGDDFKKEFPQNTEVGWHLVSKTKKSGSTDKQFQEQLVLLSPDEETPSAQVMVYAIIGHYLATGERLFDNTYVRTSSVASTRHQISIGYFTSDGLVVKTKPAYLNDYSRAYYIGLAHEVS